MIRKKNYSEKTVEPDKTPKEREELSSTTTSLSSLRRMFGWAFDQGGKVYDPSY